MKPGVRIFLQAAALALAFVLGGWCVRWIDMHRTASAPVPPKPAAPATAKNGPDIPGRPAPVPPKPAPPPEILYPKPDEAAAVLDAVRSQYADAQTLLGQQMDAAKVNELLAKFPSKLRILPAPPVTDGPAARIMTEMLPHGVLYWRVPGFARGDIDALVKQWDTWRGQNPAGLVIDLRDTVTPQDFAGASDFAGLFVNPETPLFTVQDLRNPQQIYRSQRQPLTLRTSFPVVVLVNQGTAGAAELLAEVLHLRPATLLVGMPTAGESGQFANIRLKSGRVLHLATAYATLASGVRMLGTPVRPDLEVLADGAQERASRDSLVQGGKAADLIAEIPVRKKQNEAALMNDENPEIDEMLAEQNGGAAPEAPKIRDVALQRASDLVRGIAVQTQNAPSGPRTN
jgi:hypothetical protein